MGVIKINILERISVNPEICHGKPCIKGTRIPVYVILDSLASGMSYNEIKNEYPPLTDEDIKASLQFAVSLANEEEFELKVA